MGEFLICKWDAASSVGWRPVTVVEANVPSTLDEARSIVKQGFVGPGKYAVVRWDNRKEYNMGAGAPDVADVA